MREVLHVWLLWALTGRGQRIANINSVLEVLHIGFRRGLIGREELTVKSIYFAINPLFFNRKLIAKYIDLTVIANLDFV